MPSVDYSVVIVNFNGGAYLQKAVDSLAGQTERNFEVIVVDNNSTDGSMDSLDTCQLPRVQIIRNDENLGFAQANNQAAKRASGRWLVLLNPDAAARPDWLDKLGCAARQYPNCRVFTSTQYDMNNADAMDGAGDAYLLFGFPWRGGYGQSRQRLPGTGLCFSACGAGAMYDRQLFLSAGGFDERFFCYCEDVDLGFRLQLEGEPCIFVSDAVIWHAGSAISGRHSGFAAYHGTRNRIWTFAKNMPTPLLVLTLPVHFILSVYFMLRAATVGTFWATVRGTWDAVLELPHILSDRRWRSHRSVRISQLAQAMAWNPILMNRRRPHVRKIETAKAELVVRPEHAAHDPS